MTQPLLKVDVLLEGISCPDGSPVKFEFTYNLDYCFYDFQNELTKIYRRQPAYLDSIDDLIKKANSIFQDPEMEIHEYGNMTAEILKNKPFIVDKVFSSFTLSPDHPNKYLLFNKDKRAFEFECDKKYLLIIRKRGK